MEYYGSKHPKYDFYIYSRNTDHTTTNYSNNNSTTNIFIAIFLYTHSNYIYIYYSNIYYLYMDIYIYINYHNTTMIHVIISTLLATQVVIFPSQDLEALGLHCFSMGKNGGFRQGKTGWNGWGSCCRKWIPMDPAVASERTWDWGLIYENLEG